MGIFQWANDYIMPDKAIDRIDLKILHKVGSTRASVLLEFGPDPDQDPDSRIFKGFFTIGRWGHGYFIGTLVEWLSIFISIKWLDMSEDPELGFESGSRIRIQNPDPDPKSQNVWK